MRYLLTTLLLVCSPILILSPRAEDAVGFNAAYLQTAMDNAGNIHMIYIAYGFGPAYYTKYDGSNWSETPTYFPWSEPCWLNYTKPGIAVGPDGLAQVVYGIFTGNMDNFPDFPNDLDYFFYAKALDEDGSEFEWEQIGSDGYRYGFFAIAVDDANQPHICHTKTSKSAPWFWEVIYRRPGGTNIIVQHATNEVYRPDAPRIAYSNGVVHIAWAQATYPNPMTDVWYASYNANTGAELNYAKLSSMPSEWFAGGVDIAVGPDGPVITYLVADWGVHPPLHKGVHMTIPGWTDGVLLGEGEAQIHEAQHEEYHANVTFDSTGDRYLSWYYYGNNETYYKKNWDPRHTIEPWGIIDIAAGTAGAYYVRTYGLPGPVHMEQISQGGGNIAPSLTILTPPSGNAEANLSYTISWDDTDPDDNALISLYYDNNSGGFNGTLIPGAQDITEDPDGVSDRFVWDISNLPDDNSYYVYGFIDDGVNPPIGDYSSGYLFVNHQNDAPWINLTAPAGNDTAQGDIYTIEWGDWDPDDNATISLYYSSVNTPTDSTLIITGLSEDSAVDEYSWDLTGVEPGTYRIYATIDDGQESTGDHSDGTVTALIIVVYTPTDDASVYRDWEPNLPHGDRPDLDFGADDENHPDEMAFFRFDVSGLGYGIIRATLKVYCVGDGGGGGVFSVTSTDWTEETLTWNNMPGIGLSPVSSIDWLYLNNWYSYDVTSLVLSGGVHAFCLRSEEPDGAHITSKEYAAHTLRPYLELTVGGDPPMLPPTAQIVSITPNPVIQGYHSQVEFAGNGWDNDEGGESIEAWLWQSDLDGNISSQRNFSLDPSTLSAGTHEISLKVRDNEGDWSDPDTDDLLVKPPDTTGPTWNSGTGIQMLQNAGIGGKLQVAWNSATDDNPPITYNLYYNTSTPAFAGIVLESVDYTAGLTYDCNYALSGLTNGQTYYVGVRAVDLIGNEDTNEVELSATPSDITPPSFTTGPSAVDITATSARIQWITNEPATSIVGYWITPDESLTVENFSYVTSHSMELTGLIPGIVYFYRAYSSDQANNEAMSDIENFMTSSSPTYSYLPTDDAYVVSWEPGENFGGSARLIVESNEISYLMFSVPAQEAQISNARLQVFCAAKGDTAAIWSITDTGWDESTIVWSNKPAIDGPFAGGIGSPEEGQMYSVDVSQIITDTGDWAFAMDGPARSVCQFYSKEHTAEAERPYLVVQFSDDIEPPTRVTGLTCTPLGISDIQLLWSPSTDNIAVAGYRVYRSPEPYFELLPYRIVATLETTEYTDAGVLGDANVEHYYVITAFDDAQNESEASDTVGESEFQTGGGSR